jgi:hypothetical protein
VHNKLPPRASELQRQLSFVAKHNKSFPYLSSSFGVIPVMLRLEMQLFAGFSLT